MEGEYCAFCDPKQLEGRTIVETENFVVLPTIGQISDGGHLLIFPRDHRLACLGMMDEAQFAEFEDLKARVQEATIVEYGPVLNFEHGIIGQSVSHAHLQILPCEGYDLLHWLQKDYPFSKEIDTISDLRDIYSRRRVYLYYQQPSTAKTAGNHHVFYMDAIPQYLRLVAAEVMGRTPRGNWKTWREDPDIAEVDNRLMSETVDTLQSRLS